MYDEVLKSMGARASGRPALLERAFATIDPANDLEAWSGLRDIVLQAVEALHVERVAAQLGRLEGVPRATHSDIETLMDELLKDELRTEMGLSWKSKEAMNRARYLRKWRAIIALRQIGLATGHFAFRGAAEAWLGEHFRALTGSGPAPIRAGLGALVLPSKDGNEFYLAPLRPRTFPFRENPPAYQLLTEISRAQMVVRTIADGDSLLAEVVETENSRPIANLVVDLPIVREALLQQTASTGSFTEIGYSAFARIERARAAFVSRKRLSSGTVLWFDDDGVQNTITAEPGAKVPFRLFRGK
jgi:hypothetical protein